MTYEALELPQEPSPLRCYEDIRLSEGTLSSVYIGPGGIYAIAESTDEPHALYLTLRNLLGTARLRLYITDVGLYDTFSRKVTEQLTDEELDEQILAWTCPPEPMWDDKKVALYEMKLKKADMVSRGEYIDEEGNLYLLRGDAFLLTSPLSAERMFYLTLFTGALGFHRFYAGKHFSGLFYFLTGGIFGIGWLLDLLSLFSGSQKDKAKRYFAPLKNPLKKLLLLPLGLLATVGCALLQMVCMTAILNTLNAGTASQIQHVDSDAMAEEVGGNIQQLVDWLSGYFGE